MSAINLPRLADDDIESEASMAPRKNEAQLSNRIQMATLAVMVIQAIIGLWVGYTIGAFHAGQKMQEWDAAAKQTDELRRLNEEWRKAISEQVDRATNRDRELRNNTYGGNK